MMATSFEVLKALNRISKYFGALHAAANRCIVSLADGAKYSSRHIQFLDADVLCVASPSIAVSNLAYSIKSTETDIEQHLYELGMPHLFGPNLLRFHLERLKDYSVPMGTKIEMIDQRQQIDSKVRQTGTTAVSALSRLRNSSDPIKEIRIAFGGSRELSNRLKAELGKVNRGIDDIRLINDVLDNETPVDSIWKSPFDGEAGKAYRKALSRFKVARPRNSRANFCDSLNIETVARIFVQQRNSSRPEILPQLISTTEWLQLIEGPIHRDLPRIGDFNLFEDYHYLLLFQSFGAEFGWSNQLCHDVASKFAADSIELFKVVSSTIEMIETVYPEDIRSSTGFSVADIDDLQWELFCRKISRMKTEYDFVFEDSTDLWVQDQHQLTKFLGSNEVENELRNVENPAAARAVLDKIQNRIREYRHPCRELWKLVWSGVDNGEPAVEVDRSRELFEITWTRGEGSYLAKSSRRAPAHLLEQEKPCITDDVRFFVHNQIIHRGALLTIDIESRANKRGSDLVFLWIHELEQVAVWDVVIAFLLNEGARAFKTLFEIVFVTQNSRTVFSYIPGTTATKLFDMAVDTGASFIEVRIGDALIFWDLEYLDDVERQFGLRTSGESISDEMVSFITKLLEATHFAGVDSSSWHIVLSKALTSIRSVIVK